jgi:hypothetical protein
MNDRKGHFALGWRPRALARIAKTDDGSFPCTLFIAHVRVSGLGGGANGVPLIFV